MAVFGPATLAATHAVNLDRTIHRLISKRHPENYIPLNALTEHY